MADTPIFDHIALTVPNLEAQVDRLVDDLGMVAQMRTGFMSVLVDPRTNIKLELSPSDDGEVHVRHLGFCADDVDGAHSILLAAGMETARPPQRQDFAAMYTSYLSQPGGIEIQLVRYDD